MPYLALPNVRPGPPPYFGCEVLEKGTFGAKGAFLENFYDFFEKFVNKNDIFEKMRVKNFSQKMTS